jgi:tetratricopeptide (TPR) repeat protein
MKKILTLIVSALLIPLASAQQSAGQADALYRRGQAAEKAGDPAAAEKAYTEALRANPNHANARFSLGQLKIHAGSIAAKGREAKLGAVMIPEFKLDDASLQEALDALGLLIEKQSQDALAPNFIIQDPENRLASTKIVLNLKNTPAKAVIQYLMEQASAKIRYDEHATIISPK